MVRRPPHGKKERVRRPSIITMAPTRAEKIDAAVKTALGPISRKVPQSIEGARKIIYGLARQSPGLTKGEAADARRRIEAHFERLGEIKREQERALEAIRTGQEISKVQPAETPFHKTVRERLIIQAKSPGAQFGTYSPEYNIFLLKNDPLASSLVKAVKSMEEKGVSSLKSDHFEISRRRIHDIGEKIRTRRATLEEYVFWLGEMKKHGFLAKNFPEGKINDLLRFNGESKNFNNAVAVAIEQKLISPETAAKLLTGKIKLEKNKTPAFLQRRTPAEIGEYRDLVRQSSFFVHEVQNQFQKEITKRLRENPHALRRGPAAINEIYEIAQKTAYKKAGMIRIKKSKRAETN